MLMMRRAARRRRRQRQDGQAMILALSLIAVVSVTTISITRFSDVTVLQEHRNEATAAADSLIEGGAAFSVADADRGSLSSDTVNGWTCLGQPTGTIQMQPRPGQSTGDVVGYNTKSCNPPQATNQFRGFSCSICALSTTATLGIFDHNFTFDLCAPPGTCTTVGATMVSNSPVKFQSACVRAKEVRYVGSATLAKETGNGCSWSPDFNAALPSPITPILDPLSFLPPPSFPMTDFGDVSYMGSATIQPGRYHNLSVSGSGTLTMSPGTYVITGAFSVTAQMQISGVGVLLYFTCGPSATPTACSNAGQPGGSLSIGGTSAARVSITAATTGYFANLAIFYDRHNTSPLSVTGGGIYSITGATYAAKAQFLLGGGGGAAQFGGPIIVDTVAINGSGGGGMTMQSLGAAFMSCSVFDNQVTVGGTAKGHDVVQSSACGGTGIDSLNYGP